MFYKTSPKCSQFRSPCLGIPVNILTEQEREDVEIVLKTGLKIIWGQDYTTFHDILKKSSLKTMRQVREKIVNKFLRKTIKHSKFRKWFAEDTSARMNTRAGNRTRFKPVPARKQFYQKSPIPTLTSLANTVV